MKKTLVSILMPTYNRYGRLYRGLIYLLQVFSSPRFKSLRDSFELVIADGSDNNYKDPSGGASKEKVMGILVELGKSIRVEYLERPGSSLFERISMLSKSAKGEYVTLLGDEDLLVFDSLNHWISEMDREPEVAAITGQYVGIKGFESLGRRLKIYLEEGFVHGVCIKSEDVKERFFEWKVLSIASIPPISYAVMRAKIFHHFADCLQDKYNSFTFSGAEQLLNSFIVAAGTVKIKDSPYVLRDFTYLNHSSVDPSWSDPSRDEKACLESLRGVCSAYNCFEGESEIQNLAKQLQLISLVGHEPRFSLLKLVAPAQKILAEEIREKLHPATLAFATRSWRCTAKMCYSESQLSIVGFIQFSPPRLARMVWRKLKILFRLS